MKINAKLKKVFTAVSYAFVAALILFVAVLLFLNLSGKPSFICGYSVMWVKTESMEPTIPAQSYILVKEATAQDVKVGDVIVFKSDDPTLKGALNTHKVDEILNGGAEFVTIGENNNGIRDRVTAKADKIVGIYKRNLPFLSFFGRFLATSGGITIMVVLLFAITLAVFLPDAIGAIRERSKKARMDALLKDEIEKLKSEDNESKDD